MATECLRRGPLNRPMVTPAPVPTPARNPTQGLLLMAFLSSMLGIAATAGCGKPLPQGADNASADNKNLEILPGAASIIPSLGTGWSTLAEGYLGRCIAPASKQLPSQDAAATLKISNTLDAEKAQQHMGFQIGAKAHFGIGSASLKAQAASAMTRDAFSSVWVFQAHYVADADEIDIEQKIPLTVIGTLAKEGNAWRRECGDEFVFQIQKGAQLFIVYRLDFKSESVKHTLEAELRGAYNLL